MEQMKTQCWVCSVPVKLPHGEFCLYKLHAHPLWETPCCCLCADLVADLDDDNDDNDDDVCRACGRHPYEQLVVCDECDRDYCEICLAQAYGGEATGWQAVQGLLASDDPWKCPGCEKPAVLAKLVGDIKLQEARAAQNRSGTVVINQLQRVHFELRHTDAELDKEEQTKAEIEEEVRRSDPDALDVKETVEAEFSIWKTQLSEHRERLCQHESVLQDELETNFGLDLSDVYQQAVGNDRQKLNPDAPDPEYVRRANEQIHQYYASRPELPFPQGKENYDNVEEIREFETEPRATAQYSLEELAEARRIEEQFHPEVLAAKKTSEEDDQGETKREEDEDTANGICSVQKLVVAQRRRVETMRRAGTAGVAVRAAGDSGPSQSRRNDRRPNLFRSLQNRTSQSEKPASRNDDDHNDIESSPPSPSKLRLEAGKKCIFDLSFLPDMLKKDLKDHQVEGIDFLWKNCFTDAPIPRGGSILAHNMGLGKTLTVLSFLYACVDQKLVKNVLIVVPTNTIGSWKKEFDTWLTPLPGNRICLDDATEATDKGYKMERFMKRDCPGAFLVSHQSLEKVVDAALNVDMVIIDECHVGLKNTATNFSKAAHKLKTKLRIGLTGTPISNNLREYHAIMSFFRPDFLKPISEFEREFIDPILKGMPSDCTPAEKQVSDDKTKEIFKILKPIVHRKDASFLAQDLPPLNHVVLHLRPSKLQQSIIRSFRAAKGRNEGYTNFFTAWKCMAPVNNHPATLLGDAGDAQNCDSKVKSFWKKIRDKFGEEELKKIDGGYKVVLLLKILVEAEKLNEKVLVFSGCLKTLDFVTEVLQSEDWRSLVPDLPVPEGGKVGGWKLGQDFLRIDGSVNAADRSKNVDGFQSAENSTRAFLLSAKACGMGITLTAASRVVIMDTDFNPTVSQQAIFRSYRYGQDKPVYVYRFLTVGTMEEKVYARCVTKTGLASRVIDKQSFKRAFSKNELHSLQENFNWVQCDRCNKWRVLLDQDGEELPDQWYCSLNTDQQNNSCSHGEKSHAWYESLLARNGLETDSDGDGDAIVVDVRDDASEALAQKDPILQQLLLTLNEKGTEVVSKYKFNQSCASSLKDPSLASVSSVKTEPVEVLDSSPATAPTSGEDDKKPAAVPTGRKTSRTASRSTSTVDALDQRSNGGNSASSTPNSGTKRTAARSDSSRKKKPKTESPISEGDATMPVEPVARAGEKRKSEASKQSKAKCHPAHPKAEPAVARGEGGKLSKTGGADDKPKKVAPSRTGRSKQDAICIDSDVESDSDATVDPASYNDPDLADGVHIC